MNKKIQLLCLALLGTLTFKAQYQPHGTSGTPAPSQQWESWFSGEVEKFKENYKNNQARLVTYDIPVIVHILNAGETVGTYPNIDSNQVKSQIIALNQDYNALGVGTATIPPVFAGLVASTGIKFCRAKINPVGNPVTELGVDRINYVSNGWQNPATPTLNLQNYMNTVIIPATIWDPTKYLNIWVSDRAPNSTLLGFATYPGGTSLNGLFGGAIGTSTNDGVWIYAKAFGTTGTVNAPNDKGRTATREIGHWLGLRNIWGDGNCLSDYCGDTPAHSGPHFGPVLYQNTPIDQCGVNMAPFREMPLNYMDMTDDDYRVMFTNDQNLRMQTAMSQCTNRNLLGTHGICTGTPLPTSTSSAIASFALGSVQCLGTPITPYNTSSGYPAPTFVWSSAPAASFSPATTVANPAIQFNNPGTYTITLVATNSISSTSYSMVVSSTFSCTPFTACVDTVRMIKNTETLTSLYTPSSNIVLGCTGTGFKGYLVGTNCYKEKEFAQYFPPSSYGSVSFPQVNSVIVLFDSIGTKATNNAAPINCKIYGGTVGNGPGAVIGMQTTSLAAITLFSPKPTSVPYLGIPNLTAAHANTLVATKIIPYKFNFSTPVIINQSSGFFAGIEGPLANSGDSINIMSDKHNNLSPDSSAWFLQFNNSWRHYKSKGYRIHLAIIPQITCSGINNIAEVKNSLSSNVNVVPNPNNGLFNLIFTFEESRQIELNIYNSVGQLVSQDKLNNVSSNVFELDLRDKPNGVYFAKLSNENETIVKKIIVSH